MKNSFCVNYSNRHVYAIFKQTRREKYFWNYRVSISKILFLHKGHENFGKNCQNQLIPHSGIKQRLQFFFLIKENN